MVIERGKTEMLECRVKGKPPPLISWWRDGKQVPHDADQHPHDLWHHDHLETGFSLLLGIIYGIYTFSGGRLRSHIRGRCCRLVGVQVIITMVMVIMIMFIVMVGMMVIIFHDDGESDERSMPTYLPR